MCRYFSHDVGAHYHRKIRRLRGAHGWAGYGLYWAILELLREEDGDGYTLPLDYNALKAAFGVPAKKIKGIVEGFGLFVIDEEREVFYSPGLIERMQLMRHKYQPPTLADEPPTEEEDERKAELSRKRAEAGSKG
ncbi:MAG: DUF4373 domain-containing protein, partial [Porphyromonadaceae bacterium]|nr:DUF4373 domain-containing protein [Porphyromonadaceae bacterium]